MLPGFLTVVPDFYHSQAMKPVEWSKIPDFLAKFPVDKARSRLLRSFYWFCIFCKHT